MSQKVVRKCVLKSQLFKFLCKSVRPLFVVNLDKESASDLCSSCFYSSDDIEICSLKVLELEGSPSRMLLRLMGERGCTLGHLMDYLQTLANPDAVQCLKPSRTVKHYSLFL